MLTVSTNNIAYTIQCIASFDLHVDSVDKQHTIHNTMKKPYNLHTIDKVTMSGFLSI